MLMKKIVLATTTSFVMLTLLVSCAGASATSSDSLIPSIYFKPTVNAESVQCQPADKVKMEGTDGSVLTELCPQDYKQCLLQGSCFVSSEGQTRSYNIAAKNSDGEFTFVEVDVNRCPYGYGVRNTCLDPYFSVAADLKYYKVGDVIYVPRLVGAVLPNGEVHDGFLIVRDDGGGIKGPHRFDFFTGFFNHLAKQNTLAILGFGDPNHRYEFRKATAAEAEQARERRGYPDLPVKDDKH